MKVNRETMNIWKFPLRQNACEVTMPTGAKILCVHNQHDNPCLWALVDPQAPQETRHFRVFGTGGNIDATGLSYIGTAHKIEGWMVLHVFEKMED